MVVANEGHVARLKEAVDAWDAWREKGWSGDRTSAKRTLKGPSSPEPSGSTARRYKEGSIGEPIFEEEETT